ncbi:MAG TPA: TadE family protein [Acidimicrobiales bacterium]|jgi:Flp pilus assembly protein TadG|nr:TadE family protein [Acidimicrobiales bacterium]
MRARSHGTPPAATGDRSRSERGVALVEFAIVAPLLFFLLFGLIDFGVNLSNEIALRQGVREGARQGSVANFGPTASCGATFTTPGSANMQKLICLTKSRTDMTASEVAIAIRFDPTSTSYPAGATTASPPVGNGIIVCAVTPMASPSKFLSPILSGKYLKTKTTMRIEKGSGVAESIANEADPTGANWSWCKP